MTFIKGQSGNLSGKPPGTLSKKTKDHISRAQKLIEAIEKHPKFETMLDTLTEREIAVLYKDLLEYLEPKLARTEHTDGEGGPLVLNVRHSVEPLPAPKQQPVIETYADFEVLPPTTKRPF